MEKLHCPYCNTVIRRSSAYVDECPVFARHLDRCERATERERAFYRTHRRWPLSSTTKAVSLPGTGETYRISFPDERSSSKQHVELI